MATDTSVSSSQVSAPTPHRWLALAAVALGVSLIIMDATVVNVALPVIIRDVDLTSTQAEWMNAVYSLMFAALLLTAGRATRSGHRRGAHIARHAIHRQCRVQGAREGDRIRGMGLDYRGHGRGGAAGRGWLTTDYTWRWAFWINIPVGLAVLAPTLYVVPETRDDTAPRSLDIVGALLSAAGLGAIVFALIEGGNYGWWLQDSGALSPVPVLLVIGVLLMVVFVFHQGRRDRAGKVVLVNLALLGIRSFRYGSLAALVVALGEFGLLFTLPLLLQNALGYSALGTGWLIVSLAVGTFIVSGLTPQLTRRFGGRAVVRAGLAAEAVAVGGLAITLSASIGGWTIASWLFPYGLGVGMATAQLTSVILTDVPVAQSGQASGLQSTFRQLGSSLGVAILGTLLITSLGQTTRANLDDLDDLGLPAGEVDQVSETVQDSVGSAIPALQKDQQTADAGDAAASAMITASRITTGTGAVIILFGLAATLALPPTPPDKDGDDKAKKRRRATA